MSEIYYEIRDELVKAILAKNHYRKRHLLALAEVVLPLKEYEVLFEDAEQRATNTRRMNKALLN